MDRLTRLFLVISILALLWVSGYVYSLIKENEYDIQPIIDIPFNETNETYVTFRQYNCSFIKENNKAMLGIEVNDSFPFFMCMIAEAKQKHWSINEMLEEYKMNIIQEEYWNNFIVT